MSNIGKKFTTTKGEEVTIKEYAGKGVDLTGQVFGEREVLGYAGNKEWVVQCSCGNIDVVRGRQLKKGEGYMCKACTMKKRGEDKREDLTGQVFGERTVLEFAGVRKGTGAMWKVQCSCGKIDVVRSYGVKNSTMCADCVKKELRRGMEEDIKIIEGKKMYSNLYIARIADRVTIGNITHILKSKYPDVKPVLNPFGQIAGYYMTEEQTVSVLKSLRTPTKEVKEILKELEGFVEVESPEGQLHSRIIKSLKRLDHKGLPPLTLNTQEKVEDSTSDKHYRFDFFIPEVNLYVEFNERNSKGSHHKPEYDAEKATCLAKEREGATLLTVWGDLHPTINARYVEDKIVELLLKKS